MKHFVLGTAGHVDHGKTALIKALTGIDTDRLKEEKQRGITIELGFASLKLPSGLTLGIVDVPGHEKFVKHMVSGAAGIDLVLMVIAADEGIMPQTREHLHICSLLGISRGIVALTKIDLVEKDWLNLVESEITDFLRGTFLESAPVIPVSAIKQEGLSELLQALDTIIAEITARTDDGIFRLPVDRIFTMKGFGTIVTGTLVSDHLKTGEDVQILPQNISARIRGIQVHNRPEEPGPDSVQRSTCKVLKNPPSCEAMFWCGRTPSGLRSGWISPSTIFSPIPKVLKTARWFGCTPARTKSFPGLFFWIQMNLPPGSKDTPNSFFLKKTLLSPAIILSCAVIPRLPPSAAASLSIRFRKNINGSTAERSKN